MNTRRGAPRAWVLGGARGAVRVVAALALLAIGGCADDAAGEAFLEDAGATAPIDAASDAADAPLDAMPDGADAEAGDAGDAAGD
jgi:hypothetical protein